MAAKSPRVAQAANALAGLILLVLCVPFVLLGGLVRRHYGPDSPYAHFATDTCSAPLGLPSCAQWLPEGDTAVFKMLWEKMNRVLGTWVVVAIMAASMSTSTGAILATSTVMAHNLWRKIPKFGTRDENLLLVARCFTLPMAIIACGVAATAYNPGYLLVVAFDVVLAGCLVPLLAAVYFKPTTPNAAILALLSGSITRIVLEFALKKDGSLVAVGSNAFGYGPALPGLPSFMQITPPSAAPEFEAAIWDPFKDTCNQPRLRDWTGIDSVVSPVVSLLVLLLVTAIETAGSGSRDLLFFLPRGWRSPTGVLYPPEEDYTVHREARAAVVAAAGLGAGAGGGGGGLFDGPWGGLAPATPVGGQAANKDVEARDDTAHKVQPRVGKDVMQ